MVKAVAKGDQSIIALHIDPKAIDPTDPDLLQDLVLTAVNGALEQVRETAAGEMAKVTGGMMPGGVPGFG
jgi:hypothetical protein